MSWETKQNPSSSKINTIYISTISCREQYLEQTIKSAISNAKYPNRLRVGIFNTDPDGNPVNIISEEVKIDIINCSSQKPLGVGASRMNATLMCPLDFDFLLQIDAHMIFEKDWDEVLENEFLKIESNKVKPIISFHTIPWRPGINGEVFINNLIVDPYNVEKGGTYSAPVMKYKEIEDSLFQQYPQTWGENKKWEDGEEYKESCSVSGNFMFARASLFRDIIHDPRCYWGADEGVFAMRAWTRGYKIFSLNKHIIYHLDKEPFRYTPEDINPIKKDWRSLMDTEFNSKLANTYKIIEDILTGKELGYWGAPSQELLDKYSYVSGFNFKAYYDRIKEIKLKGE